AASGEAFSSDAAPPRLGLLVDSADATGHAPIAGGPLQMGREAVDVNVVAAAEPARVRLAAMPETQGQERAHHLAAGTKAGPGYRPYAASKFALKAITDALREEERGKVRVSSVHPGKVDSDMQRELQAQAGNANYDPGVYVRAEDVAAAVRLAAEMGPEACL